MTSVLINNSGHTFRAGRSHHAQLVEKLTDIDNLARKRLCRRFFGRTFQNERVLLQAGTTAGGVGQNGIQAIRKGLKVFPGKPTGMLPSSNMPTERTAASLTARNHHLDSVAD